MNLKHIAIFTLNCTWGIIQFTLGLLYFISVINKPHFWYKGSIVTTNVKPRIFKTAGGVSYGAFIFITADISKDDLCSDYLTNHEYGHTLQSVLLGPLYFIIIEIPSTIWLTFFRKWRKRNQKYYNWLYTESWADKWGGVGGAKWRDW